MRCEPEIRRSQVTRRAVVRAGAGLIAGISTPVFAKERLVVVEPRSIDDLLANPGMGWQTFHRFADEDPALQGLLSSSAYFRLYWREIEPAESQFDFPKLDALFARARKAGQRLAFRIMCVGTDTSPMDCPAWLKAKGCRGVEFTCGDDKLVRWAPDWEDPKFQEAHFRLIKELGKRYDGSPDMDLLDIGTVGLWGEWHMSGCKDTSGKPAPMPAEATRLAIIDAWRAAFPRTPKVMLIGDEPGMRHATHHGCGWRADCLGDMGGFSKSWNHMRHFYMQQLAKTDAESAWKTGPVAFESCWDMRKWVEEGWDVRFIFDYALRCHVSYVNNKSAPIPAGARTEVERFLSKLGYRLIVKKVAHTAAVRRGGALTIAATWENVGVAPAYGAYRVALRVRAADSSVSIAAFMKITEHRIRDWLPGTHDIETAIPIPRTARPGVYEVSVAVVDTLSRPAVRLAIAGRAADGWYPLSSVKVT